MPQIRILRSPADDVLGQLRLLRAPLQLSRLILEESPEARTVQEILTDVRQRGDQAVSEITARVDHVQVAAKDVRVPREQIREAHQDLPAPLRKAVEQAVASVREFQQYILEQAREPLHVGGRVLEMRTRPIRRVGVCVPGAAAPLLSSVIHSAVPAQVAGVKEIAIVVPPRHNGDVHPTILGVAGALGIDEVYRMGGAQAIAALAFGTPRVPRVDKIVGPGGMYVQLAKRWLYGVVDIDMFAATTEVLILADESANPVYLAADMLAQAEHNPGCSILITNTESLVEPVLAELDRQLAILSTGKAAARWLEHFGAIAVVPDTAKMVALADDIAPEHLEIETRNPRDLAEKINYAGAIFLGHYSPESSGDYVAGPSHVLPTGGTARFWSGVSALSFLRHSSMIEYTPQALARDATAIDLLARAEGLEGHARSATIRVEKK